MTRTLTLIGGVLGVLVACAGLALLVAPAFASQLWGLRMLGDDPVWQYETGIRELTVGVLIAVLAWKKQTRALGYALLVLAPIPAVDFMMAWSHGAGVFSLQHLPPIPGMLIVGVLLLRASD